MNNINKLKFLFIFLFSFLVKQEIIAQNNFIEYKYIDTNNLGLGFVNASVTYQNSIIVAGSFTDRFNTNPSVKRVDTLGNVLWSSTVSDTSVSYSMCSPSVLKIMLVDSFIYYVAAYGDSPPYTKSLTKMNANTGIKVWQTMYNLDMYAVYDLENINTNSIAMYYFNSNSYLFYVSKIDKATGATVHYPMDGIPSLMNYTANTMCKDASNNLYITKGDSILKINSSTMAVIWAKSYSTTTLVDVQMTEIMNTASDSIIAILYAPYVSNGLYTYTMSINKQNGNIGWMTNNSVLGSKNGTSLISGNYIYTTYNALLSPAADPYRINKINFTNGNEEWANSFTLNNVYDIALRHIDVDNNNVYAITNDYCSPKVLKLNATNGNYISNVLLQGNSVCVQSSASSEIHLLNGKLFTVSNSIKNNSIQNFYQVDFCKLEPTTLNIEKRMAIDGSYHYSSRTIDIKSRANNKKLVLKKTGKSGELVMYNSNKQVEWMQSIGGEYYSEFAPISYTNDKRIVVTSFNYSSNCYTPIHMYTEYISNITMEYFDSLGTSLYKYTHPVFNSSIYTSFESPIIQTLSDTGYHAYILFNGLTTTNNFLELNDQGIVYIGATNLNGTYSTIPYNVLANNTVIDNIDSFTYININDNNIINYYQFNKASASNTLIKNIALNKKCDYYTYVNAQNAFVYGTSNTSNIYTIEKFNNTTNVVSWSTPVTYPVAKIIIDNNNQFVYVITNRVDWLRETIIYKINLQTGAIVWQRTNGTSLNNISLDFNATDIDVSTNYISVAAKRLYTSPKKIALFQFDLNGNSIDSFMSVQDDVYDDNRNLLTHWADESVWLYGSSRVASNQLYGYHQGFIFDTDSITNITTHTSLISKNENECMIYPNPSNGNFYLSIVNNLNNNITQFEITNITGQKIDCQIIKKNENLFECSVNNFAKNQLYFVRYKLNNTLLTQKIFLQ